MLERKPKNSAAAVFAAAFIFLALFALSSNLVLADGGSIAMANAYPENGGTYEVVDNILYQTTAANINTTVSVRIDSGPPIQMAYQGIRNEKAQGDTVARDWHTWQTKVPAIATPGRHTFQFFSHYYVWQTADQYWAEFDASSNPQSFVIADSLLSPSSSRLSTTTNSVYFLAALSASPIAAILLIGIFVRQRRYRAH